MSVALIEPFDRWFLSLSKDSETTRRNDCYTKCGGFDKLNHRNATLLDSLFHSYNLFSALSSVLNISIAIVIGPTPPGTGVMKLAVSRRSA